MEAPGRIAASITIIALVCMSLLAILLTKLSRARQRKQEAKAEEEVTDFQDQVFVVHVIESDNAAFPENPEDSGHTLHVHGS
ncbi:hypothetical protein LTR51_004199 [Lithohypha guttulata]|uniref:Uncharacterized protein n=1 Tax=Lithohypha guttulata TaxID=1690604 RepID=A0AAN7Y9Z4_9EURO|nr:hypothetical protein LTR51_004199 [Lithohypha guttulata]KAK5090807.1 hypothetical protein LTR05_000984 [Lithohypha guttulata]